MRLLSTQRECMGRAFRLGVIVLMLVCSIVGTAPLLSAEPRPLPLNRILTLSIDSSINPATLSYLSAGYEQARKRGYDAVLITLNTPGGLVSTTKSIITLIGESPLPTIVWISPEGASATSAGAIIASSAHVLVMANGTNIGAATPVDLSQEIKDSDLKSKAINDLVALVQSLAETRGRNKELFAEMISNAASFTSQHAKKSGLIDGIANSHNELSVLLNGRRVQVRDSERVFVATTPAYEEMEMDLGQKLLNVFANPNTAYMLFLLGAALLYVEMQAPGTFIAGSIGAICLLLAGIGFQILPVNFGALGLMILAFILFILEAFVVSYGLLSIAGVIALVSGSLFLFRTDDVYIGISQTLIFGGIVAVVLFMAFVGIFIYRDWRKNKQPDNYYTQVGKTATVIALLERNSDDGTFLYQIKVDGEIWKAHSTKEFALGAHCIVQGDHHGDMILYI